MKCPLCSRKTNSVGKHGALETFFCISCDTEFTVVFGSIRDVYKIDINGNQVPITKKKKKRRKSITPEVLLSEFKQLLKAGSKDIFADIALRYGYSAKSIQQYYYKFGVKDAVRGENK